MIPRLRVEGIGIRVCGSWDDGQRSKVEVPGSEGQRSEFRV
jgi:hypothetical protein